MLKENANNIQEPIICELCRKKIDKKQIAWSGSFVLCNQCAAYLKREEK